MSSIGMLTLGASNARRCMSSISAIEVSLTSTMCTVKSIIHRVLPIP